MSLAGNERAFLSANNWVSVETASRIRAKTIPIGATVFAKIGEALRAERFRRIVQPTAIDNNLMAAIPTDAVDDEFLTYLLSTAGLADLAGGSALPYLRSTDLERLNVSVPPLSEQRRIAGVLGSLDALIDQNQRLVSRLKEVASAAYLIVCEDGDWASFGEVAHLVRDSVPAASLAGGTPYLGLEHFGTDGAGLQSVGDAESVDSTKSRFEAGDVLYGKLRPYFRKHDRPGFGGVCTTELWVLRPNMGFGAATVDALVSNPGFTDFAMLGSGGTRMPRADWKHVATLPVRVPALSQRRQANDALDDLWRARVGLAAEIDTLTQTRDELLPLVMSGKIRVKDSDGLVA